MVPRNSLKRKRALPGFGQGSCTVDGQRLRTDTAPPEETLLRVAAAESDKKEQAIIDDLLLVPRRGFEPRTPCLKGRCSTD